MTDTEGIHVVRHGQTATASLDGLTVRSSGETMASLVEARARATVQARYTMADQRPRSWDVVRQRILQHCSRYEFAEAARWKLPRGKDRDGNKKYIEGVTIRFAEVVLGEMGNLLVEETQLYDDDSKRLIEVTVTDLERNTTYNRPVTVPKTVERNYLRDGQEAISSRTNSEGKVVHLVKATDAEILQTQNALISRAIRTEGMRLVPYDIKSEAEAACIRTIHQGGNANVDIGKRLADKFAAFGVGAEDLCKFLGHSLDRLTKDEVEELTGIFTGIKEGETTWRSEFSARFASDEEGDAPKKPAAPPTPEQRAHAEAVTELARLASEIPLTVADLIKLGAELAPPIAFSKLADLDLEQLARLHTIVEKIAPPDAPAKPKGGKKPAKPKAPAKPKGGSKAAKPKEKPIDSGEEPTDEPPPPASELDPALRIAVMNELEKLVPTVFDDDHKAQLAFGEAVRAGTGKDWDALSNEEADLLLEHLVEGWSVTDALTTDLAALRTEAKGLMKVSDLSSVEIVTRAEQVGIPDPWGGNPDNLDEGETRQLLRILRWGG